MLCEIVLEPDITNGKFNAKKNTISGYWDSFQYNTPNPSTWRYFVIGN